MPSRCYPLLSVLCSLILVALNFLLQLIALTTTWWATFSAQIKLDKPKEDGHYGLWTLCSVKGPHWTEDCDPLDTFFQVPPYSQVSGIVGVVHLLILLALLPLELLWAAQIYRNLPHLYLKPKCICIAKVSAAFIAVIFAILVATFISVGENRQKEYFIQKGWSFWVQIFVIIVNIVISLLFVFENLRFWKQHILQHVDPEGKRAETYGNPTFDADSPELPRRNHSTNGAVAYTETSGHPYDATMIANNSYLPSRLEQQVSPINQQLKENISNTLTYENESYQEHSPGVVKKMRSDNIV